MAVVLPVAKRVPALPAVLKLLQSLLAKPRRNRRVKLRQLRPAKRPPPQILLLPMHLLAMHLPHRPVMPPPRRLVTRPPIRSRSARDRTALCFAAVDQPHAGIAVLRSMLL